MRVALYVRVSTDEQATKGNSLLEQEERLKAYCKAMQWDDYELFIDDGYSAGTLERPRLKELLQRANDGEFQMIVTTKIDRLCRNLLDLLTIIDDLEIVNCGYASASESFDTSTPAGRMVLQILGAFAEFERGRIRERVRDNMRSIVRKQTDKAVTRPCFGYEVVNGNYVINDFEASIVREIAEMMLKGDGPHVIMQRINNDPRGIRTKEGNSFTSDAIRKLMKRETIAGMFVYNRRTMHKGKERIRPREEWIVIEEHHEPIISKEMFEAIQNVSAGRKQSGTQADNERWLLSGLTICGHCGSKMVGRRRVKQSGRTYHHYVCSKYQKKAQCFHHFIDRDELENDVIETLKNFDITNVRGVAGVDEVREEVLTVEQQIEAVKDRLRRLDLKMQRRLELYDEGLLSKEDFIRERELIDANRITLHNEIKQIEYSSAARAEKIAANVLSIHDDLESPERLTIKHAIRKVINSITIMNAFEVDIQFRV